jgi:hypothetical protein
MRIQTRRRIVYVHTVGVFPKANRNQPMSYSAFVLERSCQRRLPHCKCKYAFSNLNPPDRPSTIDVSRVTHLLWRDRYTTQELTAQIRHVSQSRSRASSLHMRQRVPRPASSAHVRFMFEADPHGADRSGCMLYIGATSPCNSAYPSDKRHLGVPCRSRAMLRASYQSPALRSDHGDSNRPVCAYR